jgi:hypothetical protein
MRTYATLLALASLVMVEPGRLAAQPYLAAGAGTAFAAPPPDPLAGTSDFAAGPPDPLSPTPAIGPEPPRPAGSPAPVLAAWPFGCSCEPIAEQQPENDCPPEMDVEKRFKAVWGVVDAKLFPDSRRMAPNGLPYHPIASIDLEVDLWVWRSQGLYLFGTSRFWAKQDDDQPLVAGPKSANRPSWWGLFNWSKREYDLLLGLAWNYWGPLELRAFAYGYNNLNRGISLSDPYGFNDGVGVEQRWYLSPEYARLGQEGYNVSRATFLSVGYYPSKVMVGLDGTFFAPGPFARAYLTYDIPATCCHLFADNQLIGDNGWRAKLLLSDLGLAITPFEKHPRLEFRLGTEIEADFRPNTSRSNWLPYVSVRLNY